MGPKRSSLPLFLFIFGALAAHGTGQPSAPDAVPGELLIRYTTAPRTLPPSTKGTTELWQYDPGNKRAGTLGRVVLFERLEQEGLVGLEPLVEVSDSGKTGVSSVDDLRATSTIHRLVFPPKTDVGALAAELGGMAGVVWAEPNLRGTLSYTPTDPLWIQQQVEFDAVGFREAWDLQQGANAGVRVAVIDSGVDRFHPEFSGVLDLAASFNFVDNSSTVADDRGHGTRVAGIIGAKADNGEGIAGSAFGCTLISLDVADREGSITTANLVSALNWAIAQDVHIANMSLTFQFRSMALEEACRRASEAGILLVASAGNQNQGANQVYPASYPTVMGVGATLDNGVTRAPWSNFNGTETTLVDLVAPGETIFSTVPGGQYNGTYGSGTSYSAPLVAGAAALLKARYPTQPGAALAAHLRATAAGLEPWAGSGRLDVANALSTPLVPALQVVRVRVDDRPEYAAFNDGDGIFDAGESVRLIVELASTSAAAFNVAATLSTTSPRVAALEGAFGLWPLISPAGSVTQPGQSFGLITAGADAPAGPVEFMLTLSDDNGLLGNLTIMVPLDRTFTAPLIIDGDMTWTKDRTWVINQGCIVLEGATLTIEPGTTVRFSDQPDRDNKLEIRGGLIAEGTAQEKILFTSMSGRPNGGFTIGTSLPTGAFPISVYFREEPDNSSTKLFVNNFTGNSVSFYEATSFGFSPEIRFPIAGSVRDSLFADLDLDGTDEFYVLNQTQARIEQYRVGTTLEPTGNYLPVSQNARILRAGPFGQNGGPGILIGGLTFYTARMYLEAGVLQLEEFPFIGTSLYLETGDLGNDGIAKFVTGGGSTGGLNVWAYSDNSIYTIGDPLPFPTHRNIGSILLHPFSDGSNLDILLSGTIGSNTPFVSLYRWNPTSGFGEEVRITSESRAVAKAAGRILGKDQLFWIPTGSEMNILQSTYSEGAFSPPQAIPVGLPLRYLAIGALPWKPDNVLVAVSNQQSRMLVFGPDDESNGSALHGGLWIRSGAEQVLLGHVDLQFGGILDQSTISQYRDVLVDRAAVSPAMMVTASGPPIERLRVLNNSLGNGIQARNRDLIDCIAVGNTGIGLIGRIVRRGTASGNFSGGIDCRDAEQCYSDRNFAFGIKASDTITSSTAFANRGWGFDAIGNVSIGIATQNDNGIKGRNIVDSIARENLGTGLQPSGTAERSQSIGNGGPGLTGQNMADCSIVRNAGGLTVNGNAVRSYVAENIGSPALTNGSIDSTVLIHNSGVGGQNNTSIANSWIVGNGGAGIIGRSAPYTPITSSAILRNGGVGVRSAQSISNSWLEGNSIYDYEEIRPSSEVTNVMVRENYWGPLTTAFMNANPFGPGTTGNVPAIYDLRDDIRLAQANYGDHRQSREGIGPNFEPPAFLLSVNTDDADPLGVGVQEIVLTWSEPMNTTKGLSVTFGASQPFDAQIVEASPGWQSPTRWRGTFAVTAGTLSGPQRLRISGALAADGFSVPDDTAHRFIIDQSGVNSANNAIVGSVGTVGLSITWTESGKPDDAQGYNVLATPSAGLTEQEFTAILSAESLSPDLFSRRLNTLPLTNPEFIDMNTAPRRYHLYVVHLVDVASNSFAWTPPVFGYVPGGPTGSVVVDVTPAAAPWLFVDSEGDSRSGIGSRVESGIPIGDVFFTWGSLPDWDEPTPNPDTRTLAEGATLTFSGVYIRHKGSVLVSAPSDAAWAIQDADGSTRSGVGTTLLSDLPTGTGSITWSPTNRHDLNGDATIAFSLAKDQTIELVGPYVRYTGTVEVIQHFYMSNTSVGTIMYSGIVAPWRFVDADGNVVSGSGGGWFYSIPTGMADFTWEPLDGWITPPPMSLEIPRDSIETFTGLYERAHWDSWFFE